MHPRASESKPIHDQAYDENLIATLCIRGYLDVKDAYIRKIFDDVIKIRSRQ